MHDDIPAPVPPQDDSADHTQADEPAAQMPEDLEALRLGNEVLELEDIERPDLSAEKGE